MLSCHCFLLRVLSSALLFSSVASRAEEQPAPAPLFETTLVFPATPNNRPNYRIPAILQAPNGDILIFAEKRNDGPGDIGDRDIVMKRSRDKGKTWGSEQMIFDDGKDTSTDITIGLDRTNGKLWLFFCGTKDSSTISRAATAARRGRGRCRCMRQPADALKAKQPAPKAPSPFKNIGVMKPGRLFNGVIAPLVPYTIRGCLWYQGERNANGPFTGLYGEQLETLIADWRTRWADEFYFAWVQLPGSLTPQKLPSEPNGWGVAVRDEMRRTLSVPHTGMAITMDIGDPKQGHPTNKADFARRLSTVVLHDVYAKDITLWTGPLFKSIEITEGRITLTFDHASGLKPKSDALEGFAIAGEDRKFVWADAKIQGDKITVSSLGIKESKAVRYAWAANPKGNLVSGANLPASPFRTDDWK